MESSNDEYHLHLTWYAHGTSKKLIEYTSLEKRNGYLVCKSDISHFCSKPCSVTCSLRAKAKIPTVALWALMWSTHPRCLLLLFLQSLHPSQTGLFPFSWTGQECTSGHLLLVVLSARMLFPQTAAQLTPQLLQNFVQRHLNEDYPDHSTWNYNLPLPSGSSALPSCSPWFAFPISF